MGRGQGMMVVFKRERALRARRATKNVLRTSDLGLSFSGGRSIPAGYRPPFDPNVFVSPLKALPDCTIPVLSLFLSVGSPGHPLTLFLSNAPTIIGEKTRFSLSLPLCGNSIF